jgi:stress response protein SCP2
MKTLTKGANASLTASGAVRVTLQWPPQGASLDPVCFAVGADGRVPSDAWFLFYNQPRGPDDAIQLTHPSADQAEFLIRLERLPETVQKCVFAATLDSGSFQNFTGAMLTATPTTGDALRFTLTEAADEQALIFAELYRHRSAWKVRAIGQGFKGGLRPLAEHFGLRVADEPSAPSPATPMPAPERATPPDPSPPPPPPSPPPPPPPPDPSPRRSGGFRGFLGKLFKTFAVSVGLLVIGLAAAWYFFPSLLEAPEDLLKDPRAILQRLPVEYQPPICTLADDEVFERYHALGENYVRILQRVDTSNQLLAKLRQDLMRDIQCPPSFVDQTRQEIEQLEKLPVQGWMEEATRLNICAGLMIKKIETELNGESRPIIIQRLVREADRSRNLESDLTNISRDLAYLNNKTNRLIEGYRENLDACPP